MIKEAGYYLLYQWFSSVDTSYAVYLTFIKNKSHRDSLKRPNKLEGKLEDLEINQMVNSKDFDKIKL